MEKVKPNIVIALMIAAGVSMSPATQAASYNPVTQRAQSKLAQLGFDPGTTDGILGRHTIAAIKAFQKKSGLPETGALDSATQAKLAIGAPAPQVAQVAPAPQVAQVTTVIDWRPVPTQDELDTLVANPANDSNFPYNDYRPGAPAANLDLPGAAILAAMNNSADTYGSRPPGQPKHTGEGYKYMTGCLTTGYDSSFWSDITFHYYCQMSLPRVIHMHWQVNRKTV
ncbi:MAG: peptidoglycan-binding domain-containing protein [Methylocella sp.]